MEGNVQHVVKQVSKFDGKNADDFLEWSSKLRASLSLYSKPIFEIVQDSQQPSDLDNDQATTCEGWDDANNNLFSILYFTTSGPAFSVVRRFEGKRREGGVGHKQDAWAALREKFDGCSREALRAAHREMKTVKIRSDEDPDDFLYKKDRCHDRLNSVTPKEGPSDRRNEDIILQCLPPEYDRIRQTHFERENCSLADIRRMVSKIYADNLARSNSDSLRGTAGRGVAMQATGREPSKINCHYYNKFGHYNTDCADFKAAHHQNRRRRQRHHKQRGLHQPDQPKPGGQQKQRGRGKMWCSYHKTTTHNDADYRATPTNGLNGNTHFVQVRPPSVPGVCSSWDLSGRDDSDEKPCISFLVKEVQPASKPSKARVEEKGARPFGPVLTAVTEGWRTRPWPFTPRAELQPATKPANARVEMKGARQFGPVSTAATEGWRTHPWPFTPRAEQVISFGGPVAEETFEMANDEEPVEKALMALSSVAVTSEDSANSNLATLMAPAESLPGELREPLSGGASTPSGVRVNDEEPVEKALMASSSVAVTSGYSANSNLVTLVAPAEYLLGGVREPLSGGASTPLSGGVSTPSGVRASPKTVRPSPAPVPATARTGAAIRNNRVHRPNVVTRRAAAELTGAVTRYKGVRPNRNNNDDDDNINNNHATLAERFQPSTLHKLLQLGFYAKKITPDDNNIYNNNPAALAERFQPSTLHKLRQLGLYTNTDTLDDNGIKNNNHAALVERFQPSPLHKLRQLGRCTNTDTPDTAYQLDAEAFPAEVAYTRSNAQPSCSGVGESDCVLQGGHDRLTSSHIVTLTDAPTIFKVGLQGLTAQSTMEAELVVAALRMKEEAVFCSNMMSELGFGESFGSVPLHIDNTSALYIVSNHTYIPHVKHIALRYYFSVQELVKGKVSIHYVNNEDQLTDLGTKHHHSKHRHRDLVKFINDFKA